MSILQNGYVAAMLCFSALFGTFIYPLVFLRTMTPKTDSNHRLDVCITVVTGIGFVHWILRMVPFTKMLTESLHVGRPVDDAVAAIGVLATLLIDAVISHVNKHYSETFEEVVPKRPLQKTERIALSGTTCTLRPLPKTVFVAALLLLSVFAAVDCFNAVLFLSDGDLKMYYSAVVHEMLAAIFLGASGLRTLLDTRQVLMYATGFASAATAGMVTGINTNQKAIARGVRGSALGTVAALASGGYIAILFYNIIMPELDKKHRKGSLRAIGWGCVVAILLTYPLFEL